MSGFELLGPGTEQGFGPIRVKGNSREWEPGCATDGCNGKPFLGDYCVACQVARLGELFRDEDEPPDE